MSRPFTNTMGELRTTATLAGLSVDRSPWRVVVPLAGSDNNTAVIISANHELIALAADRYPDPRQASAVLMRTAEETLRNAQLMAEAPAMVRVCEALARSGPGVAMALAAQQVAVPPDLALAIHLAREIVGRID